MTFALKRRRDVRSWRDRLVVRDRRERSRETGMRAVSWFVGCGVAGILVALAIACFEAKAIPFYSRAGLVYIEGHTKTGWGLLLASLGGTLHFGLVWSKVSHLRPLWLPLTIVSMVTGLAALVLSVA